MLTLLAVLPIAVILLLMVAARWSAVRAGALAAVGAVALALGAFGFGGDDASFSPLEGVVGVLARAGWVAATVMLIIGPALGVHHLQQRTGAAEVLRAGLSRLTPDPRVAALLIAWFFTTLIEGAAGFGTPVALAAPFLVAAGFKPVAAVVAALAGHSAAVPFGAVGTPLLAQASIADADARALSWATAPYMPVIGLVLAIVVARLVGGFTTAGPPWKWAAVAYVAFFTPYVLLARFVGPELPALVGSIVGIIGFVTLLRWWLRRIRAAHPEDADDIDPDDPLHVGANTATSMSILTAGAPYVVLVAMVLVTRLIPPVRDGAQSVTWGWELFGHFSESIQPLYHPGTLLVVAFIAGGIWQRAALGDFRLAAERAVIQVLPVFAALVAMVTVAFTMSESGMTAQLAVAAAGVGAAWPLLAPVIGALGTFMTGSATASNILFTDFQARTAAATGLDSLPLLGVQGAGAAVGNLVAPHNVVAGAATVGLSGREGEVLRQLLPVAAICLVLIGVAAWVLA